MKNVPKSFLRNFCGECSKIASVDIFSRTQLLTIAKREGTQSGEKILGHAVMTSRGVAESEASRLVDGVLDLARNVEKSKTSHHMKFDVLIKNLLLIFYVKIHIRVQRCRNTSHSLLLMLDGKSQYFLTRLNSPYLCNDQDLRPKISYSRVWRHSLQDG